MRALLIFAALTCYAQSVAFAPQSVGGKSKLTLWDVSVAAPGKSAIPAAQIYAMAAAHQVGHVDATLANTILTTRAGRSILAIADQILGAGSALTAVAMVVKSGGVVTAGTAEKIQNGAIVGAGAAAITLPYVQRATPAAPNPAIAALLLGDEMKLGSDGTGHALFYSLPSAIGPFVEALKGGGQ